MAPKDIPLGIYTHINFAYALLNPKTFRLDDMDAGTASLYGDVAALKLSQPDLEVWIGEDESFADDRATIGGWAMNDPGPYQTAFSDMAGSEAKQDAFFDSLLTFMKKHDLDGVDLDWEYPVADDRGGIPEDFDNYVNLLRRLRQRLNASGRKYGISLTVALGPYALAHTNLTEIELGLELFWRNNINPERINLGLGFYGRSFTMKDPNCMSAGCEFTEGAKGGECTGTPGVLSAAEIVQIIDNGATLTFDEKAAVMIVTWDTDQWVSWDDAKTLGMKVDFANRRCLGGTMVWAIDLDDGTLIDALGENIGRPKQDTIDEWPLVFPCLGTEQPKDEL
ncbi:hypothetical protein COL922a_003305 [Colletotrichum nupharicola]|nr:hypothetical protein COL922a_003305 [Colletotrichum nupharicola]